MKGPWPAGAQETVRLVRDLHSLRHTDTLAFRALCFEFSLRHVEVGVCQRRRAEHTDNAEMFCELSPKDFSPKAASGAARRESGAYQLASSRQLWVTLQATTMEKCLKMSNSRAALGGFTPNPTYEEA